MAQFPYPPSVPRAEAARVPLPPQPGTFGVCHGSGFLSEVIRHATSSWAGHAVMYVGGGEVVEARWPKVELDAAPATEVIWANGQPLTDEQRKAIVVQAKELVGDDYDWTVYPALAAAAFYAAATKDLSHLFSNDKWWDCSGLVTYCDRSAGISLGSSSINAHLVTPADLMNLGVQNGWFV